VTASVKARDSDCCAGAEKAQTVRSADAIKNRFTIATSDGIQ
jgi:hypothetical protein